MSSDRFSQLYLARGAPTSDSIRMRTRIAEKYETLVGDYDRRAAFQSRLVADTGVNLRALSIRDARHVFDEGELRDLLDAITVFYRWRGRTDANKAEVWRSFVETVFREEGVSYRVDDDCVVHFAIDEESERARSSAVAALGDGLLKTPASLLDQAFRAMDAVPPDTKTAIRTMHECVETLVKQITDAERLNRPAIKALATAVSQMSQCDSVERVVQQKSIEALGYWADALHSYRHGQTTVEPPRPSVEIAVWVLGAGSAHCRYLAPYALARLRDINLGTP